MKRCYVCATSLTAELEECPKCQASIRFLEKLERISNRQRFLFGSIKAKTVEAKSEPEAAPTLEATKPKKPRRRRPGTTPPKPRETEAPTIRTEEIVIQNRDPEALAEPVSASRPLHHRGIAHLVDVLLCLILNAWVLKMILLITRGNLTQLVTFSLIPLLFVLLSFTALYFWLFIGLFQMSLGNLLLQKLTTSK